MKKLVKLVGILIGLIITLWVGLFFYQHYRFVITDNAFQMADVVNVSTQNVSGKILKLFKKEFEQVKKGEPLFKVDDKIYREQVNSLVYAIKSMEERRKKLEVQLERLKEELPASYRGAVKSYRASLKQIEELKKEIEIAKVNYETAVRSAKANLNAAKASLRAAEETYETARKKFKRYENLYRRRVISKQQYEEIRAAYYGALANLKGARARVKTAEEELKRAKSLKLRVLALKRQLESLKENSLALKEKVKTAQANLKRIEELGIAIRELEKSIKSKKAQLERTKELLRNTRVLSPINGYIAKKWKETGEFTSPGLPVYSIYDPETFYILGWIDEDKVKFIRVGSRTKAELEACGREFEGEVISIGKSAGSVFALIPRDTSQGDYTKVTQRVPVKVKLKEVPLNCIKPGTNVNLFIEKE